jgi:hypothetical protein
LERLYDVIAKGTIGGGCTLHGCRIGFVPRRDGDFGEETLAIMPENVPQRAKGGKKRASAQKPTE